MEYALLCATKQLSSDYTVFVPFMGSNSDYDLIASKGSVIYKLALNPKANDWDYRMIFSKEKDVIIFLHKSMWKGKLEIRFEFPTTNVGEYYWWEDFLTLNEQPIKRSTVGNTTFVMPTLINPSDPIAYDHTHPDMVRYGGVLRNKIGGAPLLRGGTGDGSFLHNAPVITSSVLENNNITPSSITWPDAETLQTDLMNASMTDIATKYNVSDRTISNWAKTYNLQVPPKGYWISKTKKAYSNKGENNEQENSKD